MRMNLVLELLDVPGQLVDALEPIGRLGANIVAVIHQRDVKTEQGTVPVQITIEGDKDTLNHVLSALEDENICIIAVDGVLRKERIMSILIGNIVDQDVKSTVDMLNALDGVNVADFNLKMSDYPKNSAARILIEAESGKRKEVLKKIKEVGKSKEFLVINEV
ncbi:MAG: amino acid-binding protein [Euryarchaeota archaeon]|nr:amino acid-binding protein [Euryarchaeota archaeon]